MILEQAIEKLSTLHPFSIFLYGSRARWDHCPDSDFEIGVVFQEKGNIHRETLNTLLQNKKISAYPIIYQELITYKVDTPFQKNIYMNDIIRSGKTLFGEKIIENLSTPEITVLDTLQDIRFNIGYGMSAVLSDRNWDIETAKSLFYKSCLFTTRNLIIGLQQEFPLWYQKIKESSKALNLWEFTYLVDLAYNVRNKKTAYQQKDLYKNIKYLNTFIESKIMELYRERGDIILIKKADLKASS